jgi:hypothetical protein
MPVTINASTSTGLVQTADTSGTIELQSNGTTELTVTSTGVTVADNLLFNSGYGSAAIGYGCRAWVNFDGTTNIAGFCTIRASGGVTSVADNATGNYTVNFNFTMPDNNYVIAGTTGFAGAGTGFVATPLNLVSGTYTTTAAPITSCTSNAGLNDGFRITVAFFR